MYTKEEFENHLLTGPILNFERRWSEQRIVFDIMPSEFLRFAENNLVRKDEGYLVNALTNIKRALDCQLELIIHEHGYGKKLRGERWNFHRKISFLREKNILAPRILGKINKSRNLLEHEFKKPDADKVEDALDVITLFVGYSKQLRRVPDIIRLGFDESTNKAFGVYFKKNELRFIIEDEGKKLFSIDEVDKSFERLLRIFYGTQPATYTLMHRDEIQDINY